ncbi:hypothetical protein ACU4GD_28470 [Cupriavidus basilensis]
MATLRAQFPETRRALPRGLRLAVLPLRHHPHRQQALRPRAQGQHGHRPPRCWRSSGRTCAARCG